MPRRDDSSTEVSIDFSRDPTKKGGRTSSQDNQLSRAREKALLNRRVKLKAKLEQKLSELRAKLGGDLQSDQLERVVELLVETEDRHRSKLADLTELTNQRLQYIHEELRAMRKSRSEAKPHTSGGSSVVTTSDISSLRR
jgi:uncharacterized membrane protein